MSSKFFLALLLLLCPEVPALAQSQSDDVVRITTNLVQIDAVVTKNGKPIKDLKAEDFELFEDGRRQEITSFAYISNVADNVSATQNTNSNNPNTASDLTSPPPLPTEVPRRRIALVVDDYGLSAQSMAEVRRQMRKFIDEQLNANDLIAIVLTSRAKRELPNFTNDKSRLNQAWEKVVWYLIGYRPSTETFDKRYHKIRARVKKSGHNVRTRSGFFGMTEEDAKRLKQTTGK